jgi:hypothetical protein
VHETNGWNQVFTGGAEMPKKLSGRYMKFITLWRKLIPG